MALDREGLILIPAASHSAENCPSARCSSWLEGPSRTTSSAKRRDEIHWSPNRTTSGPWLCLDVLSIKVMNRTGDKGQPSWSPIHLYRNRMAANKGPPTPYSWSTPHRAPRGTQSNAFSRYTKHMWTGWTKLPLTLEYPVEGEALVHCSTVGVKTTLLLLKPGCDYRWDSLRQYPGIGLTREAEKCDTL
ncbi:hypothetical protein ILYODFUR_037711 [Ilyodon furcidens]|uniref:Uncharacterized protein n=1 Tax=Ilyodon furcidens TaxID=33524 RepID=A0ABV0T5T9_9TELE